MTGTPHLLIAPELFKAEGGIARVSRLYLQAIAESFPESTLKVVVLNDAEVSPSGQSRYKASNAETIVCSRSKIRCAHAIWSAVRISGTRVICTHVHLAPLLWLAKQLGQKFEYDIVVHGIEVWKPVTRLQKLALNSARRILSISEFTRRDMLSRYPNLEEKIVILPNALDPSFSQSSDSANDTVPDTILTVSRLAAHDRTKGIDHLIEAMPKILETHPSARLRIVGEGSDRIRLEKLATASEASAQIQFLGFVPDERLKQEFTQCTLFALPSKKEGFGLVYLEAMAAGKPCIVAAAGGAPEVIDQDSGLIVPYGDIEQIASAISSALVVQWDAGKIRARAQHFSFPAFVQRWNALSSTSS